MRGKDEEQKLILSMPVSLGTVGAGKQGTNLARRVHLCHVVPLYQALIRHDRRVFPTPVYFLRKKWRVCEFRTAGSPLV